MWPQRYAHDLTPGPVSVTLLGERILKRSLSSQERVQRGAGSVENVFMRRGTQPQPRGVWSPRSWDSGQIVPHSLGGSWDLPHPDLHTASLLFHLASVWPGY